MLSATLSEIERRTKATTTLAIRNWIKLLVQRPANGLDNLYQEWFADIRPAKRLGQGLVKEVDERQNPTFKFFRGNFSKTPGDPLPNGSDPWYSIAP